MHDLVFILRIREYVLGVFANSIFRSYVDKHYFHEDPKCENFEIKMDLLRFLLPNSHSSLHVPLLQLNEGKVKERKKNACR